MDNNLIAKWKSEYGSIYVIEVEDTIIYYRSLTAWEVQSIFDLHEQNKAKVDIEQAVCVFGILDPLPVPSFDRPGSITMLSEEIWNISVPSEELMNNTISKNRKWVDSNIEKNYSLVVAGVMSRLLPSLDLTRLLDMPTSKLIKLGAIVEKLTGTDFLGGELTQQKSKATKLMDGSNISQEAADKTSDMLAQALHEHKRKLKNK